MSVMPRQIDGLVLLLFGSGLVSGCGDEPSHPWEASGPAPNPTDSAWPTPPPVESHEEPAPSPSSTAPSPPGDGVTPGSTRVGGLWVSCYGDFRPSGDPPKDVTRLALMCGPITGMRRLSKDLLEGELWGGGPPATTHVHVKKDGCYRVFAVSDENIPDLDVVVKSSRDKVLAADHGQDRWPVVQPDRAFCVLETDELTIEVAAASGRGRFAAEVWELWEADRPPD
jgi:hypothetical protein